ncbi:LysR family transcriptional regulator [Oleiphilus sp. HI0081]|jgi:LysR family transcriptional activator of nhaA|nr:MULTISPECIES: transcriptional activator NhaR [unclassified Oleiphilus]KZY43250.1 LysR family transcriptional regulator [Oleiphilus sp. HI0050]KZY87443.1 LysR family transcriptional regulator [Oleiphilus sp. HI0072]KZZ22175.1 LysR family transcriptional regulator [Oleiphilus sp. HI0081]KZZ53450.1 LysR family transcriptional regulator [Oleiphilus sp. HI0123]KZY32464.1 LysR family transcriptional regulator [Oleiphilus sp. HI0043]
MRHINYNHLLYFWTVAREGSVAKAAESLHLTPQTISGQLKMLEETIGEPLFQRVGRGLVITEMGRMVEQYADEIFSLGAELTQRVKSKQPGAPITFNVGIVNSIPKLIAYKLLEAAMKLDDPVKIVCMESDLDSLLGDLAVHKLDLVLSDRSIPTGLNVKAFSHELGSSSLSFFGTDELRHQHSGEFPELLNEAPVLLPLNDHALRRSLDDWFDQVDISPNVIAEFDDSALLKAFGEGGAGFFPAPSAMASQVERMYNVKSIGEINNVSEHFFVISPERKLKHPAVVAITDAARRSFSSISQAS